MAKEETQSSTITRFIIDVQTATMKLKASLSSNAFDVSRIQRGMAANLRNRGHPSLVVFTSASTFGIILQRYCHAISV